MLLAELISFSFSGYVVVSMSFPDVLCITFYGEVFVVALFCVFILTVCGVVFLF